MIAQSPLVAPQRPSARLQSWQEIKARKLRECEAFLAVEVAAAPEHLADRMAQIEEEQYAALAHLERCTDREWWQRHAHLDAADLLQMKPCKRCGRLLRPAEYALAARVWGCSLCGPGPQEGGDL